MENDECSPGARGDLSLEDILLQSDNHDEREVEDEQGCDGSASCARTAVQAAAAAQAFTANLRNRFVNKQIYVSQPNRPAMLLAMLTSHEQRGPSEGRK